MDKRPIKLNEDRIPEIVKALLESYFWLHTIQPEVPYERLHDDNDGTCDGKIRVTFSPDGDAWVSIDSQRPRGSLRFRMPMIGGGVSQRTRTALLILAEAIRLDNEKPLK
jgi:hypothetical protein